MRFLDELGSRTAGAQTADEVLSITTQLVGQHLAVTNCAYADMDADQDGFTIRGDWAAPGAKHILGHYSLADFGTKAVRELGAGRPLIINDNLKELAPHEAQTFQSIGIGATICMPFLKDGRLTALMAIHHAGPHAWTARELALLEEVTARSWAHIERVRSDDAARQAADRLSLATKAAGIGIWDYDPVADTLRWDVQCKALFGAVVASEVKSLAEQTAKATTEIAEQVTAIQSASDHTVAAIQEVATVIGEIDQIGAAIAAAVEQQGSATMEISRSVQSAAQGTREVSANITGVNQAADDSGEAASRVLQAAEQLSRQSNDLTGRVNRFLSEVRAA